MGWGLQLDWRVGKPTPVGQTRPTLPLVLSDCELRIVSTFLKDWKEIPRENNIS